MVMSELDKFAEFMMRNVMGHPVLGEIDWLRIVRSAELVIPRILLMLALVKRGKYNVNGSNDNVQDDQGNKTPFNGNPRHVSVWTEVQSAFIGVSDPVRGLCLRALFLDALEPFLNENIFSAKEATDILLEEFKCCHILWVRHAFNAEVEERIREERHRLKEIVARPLQILSKLSVITLDIFQDEILSFVLLHAESSRDDLSQEFCMETLLDSFPRRFHLETIETVLESISKFNMSIDIRVLISRVVETILGLDDDDKEDTEESKIALFEIIWRRVSRMLLLRVETLMAEEAILIATPLLSHALKLVPFCIDRVQAVLEFIYKCGQRASVYLDEETLSLTMASIFDLVLDGLLPSGIILALRLSFLFDILDLMTPKTASSCSLSLLGRLFDLRKGITKSSSEDDLEHQNLVRLVRHVCASHVALQEDNVIEGRLEQVRILRYCATGLFNTLLVGQIDQGLAITRQVLKDHQLLPSLIFVPIAINSWLAEVNIPKETILQLIKEWRSFCSGRQIDPPLKYSQIESTIDQEDVAKDLSLFLFDSAPLRMIETWRRCVEIWKGRQDSDAVYESMVEMLLIFEEEVTDHQAQCRILQTTVVSLTDASAVLNKADISVLATKTHGYMRRLLRSESRQQLLFSLLEAVSRMASKIEVAVVKSVAQTILKSVNMKEADLGLRHQFYRMIIDYMLHTDPDVVRDDCKDAYRV